MPEQPRDAGMPDQPAAEQENTAAGGGDDAGPQAGPDDGASRAGAGAGDRDAPAGTPAGAGAEQGTGLEFYGDSAYGSGEARDAYRQGGHDTFIKPGPLRPAVSGGFTIDDFTVDEEQGTVTCPNGVTRPDEPGPGGGLRGACAGCPLRDLCTTAKDGRSMTIHPHDGLLRAARAQARTAEFRRAYPTRSNIERTIAWTATQTGRRVKLRYIGTSKNNAWLHARCAALNLRTLVKAGLTRRAGPGPWPDRPGSPPASPHSRQAGPAGSTAGHRAPLIAGTGQDQIMTGYARRH